MEAQSDLLTILNYHVAATAVYSNQVAVNGTLTVNTGLEGQQITFSKVCYLLIKKRELEWLVSPSNIYIYWVNIQDSKNNFWVQSNTQEELPVRTRDIISSQGVVQIPEAVSKSNLENMAVSAFVLTHTLSLFYMSV